MMVNSLLFVLHNIRTAFSPQTMCLLFESGLTSEHVVGNCHGNDNVDDCRGDERRIDSPLIHKMRMSQGMDELYAYCSLVKFRKDFDVVPNNLSHCRQEKKKDSRLNRQN